MINFTIGSGKIISVKSLSFCLHIHYLIFNRRGTVVLKGSNVLQGITIDSPAGQRRE